MSILGLQSANSTSYRIFYCVKVLELCLRARREASIRGSSDHRPWTFRSLCALHLLDLLTRSTRQLFMDNRINATIQPSYWAVTRDQITCLTRPPRCDRVFGTRASRWRGRKHIDMRGFAVAPLFQVPGSTATGGVQLRKNGRRAGWGWGKADEG